jgi:hypothetical protein
MATFDQIHASSRWHRVKLGKQFQTQPCGCFGPFNILHALINAGRSSWLRSQKLYGHPPSSYVSEGHFGSRVTS